MTRLYAWARRIGVPFLGFIVWVWSLPLGPLWADDWVMVQFFSLPLFFILVIVFIYLCCLFYLCLRRVISLCSSFIRLIMLRADVCIQRVMPALGSERVPCFIK